MLESKPEELPKTKIDIILDLQKALQEHNFKTESNLKNLDKILSLEKENLKKLFLIFFKI